MMLGSCLLAGEHVSPTAANKGMTAAASVAVPIEWNRMPGLHSLQRVNNMVGNSVGKHD